MFHRPKIEEDTQTVERPAVVEAAMKAQQQPKVQQQQEIQTEEKKMTAKEEQENKQNAPARTIDVPGAKPYQMAQTGTAPRVPGSYAYPGSTAQGSVNPYGSSSAAGNATNKGRRLVIGEGITMSGEIESCDYVLVEGTLEAALKGASILEVAEAGVFYGAVEIDEATIAGRFEGDITVNGRLTVTATGSVTGSISYKELAIEAGATVDGKLSPLAAKGNAVKKGEKPSAKKTGREESSDGSELPFGAGHSAAA